MSLIINLPFPYIHEENAFMRVLFDFDLFGNTQIDHRLTEIVLTMKNALIKEMDHLKDRIDKEDGLFIIIFKPGHIGIHYECWGDKLTFPPVQAIINNKDWSSEVIGLGIVGLN